MSDGSGCSGDVCIALVVPEAFRISRDAAC